MDQPRTFEIFAGDAAGDTPPLFSTPYSADVYAADATGAYWLGIGGGFDCFLIDGNCSAGFIATRLSFHGDALQKIVGPVATQSVVGTTDAAGNLYLGIVSTVYDEFDAYPACPPAAGGLAEILEYSSSATGAAIPLRTLNAPSVTQFPICSVNAIAVNTHGNVWLAARYIAASVAFDTPTKQVLYEYGVDGSSAPIRTIFPTVDVEALATDANDDLYYLDSSSRLFRALPDGSSPTQILSNVKIVAFTIGRGGTIVAEVATPSSGLAIETFLPGTTTPLRTIAGPLTKLDPLSLDAGGQIRVTP